MSEVLVDSNVLLDVFNEDSEWFDWSAASLFDLAVGSRIVVNPIICAEISPNFDSLEDMNRWEKSSEFEFRALPWDSAFLAGRAYEAYRARGGTRRSPLPDFYIGAHAQVEKMKLLTRDVVRYRTYFPEVELICPEI
jgi:hypothetical protein